MPHFSVLSVWTAIVLALGTGGWISLAVQDPVQVPQRQGTGQNQETADSMADVPKSEWSASPGDLPPKEDLVKDWAKPDFVLFVSGQLHGYIEPCGCTGLENQSGGLQRRFEVMNLLKGRGWNVVPVDAGDQLNRDRSGLQSLVKLETVYEGLCKLMGYQAIGFGEGELRLAALELAGTINNKADPANNPFVSANVTILDPSLVSKFRLIEAGGRKILVTSVIGDGVIASLRDNDFVTQPPAQALAALSAQIQATPADLKVLMVFGGESDSGAGGGQDGAVVENEARDLPAQLARQFPIFDLVVSAGTQGDPIMIPEQIAVGNHVTRLIQTGYKGMHVGLVGFWGDRPAAEQVVYERVKLDARFEDFEKVKTANNLNPMETLFKKYQENLKALYLNPGKFPDIAFRDHPSGYTFVGSQACVDCHEEEFDIWKDGVDGEEGNGPHFRATKDLTDPGQRTWVARNFDPECLSCHVTGWNPQKYYPYETGYYDLDKDIHLHGNGCENCHGPGSQHVAAEAGDIDADEDQLKKFRREVRLTMTEAKKSHCMTCHDLDNSPDFFPEGAFEQYWAKIAHGDGIDNTDAENENAEKQP